jgi:hypothetical protein
VASNVVDGSLFDLRKDTPKNIGMLLQHELDLHLSQRVSAYCFVTRRRSYNAGLHVCSNLPSKLFNRKRLGFYPSHLKMHHSHNFTQPGRRLKRSRFLASPPSRPRWLRCAVAGILGMAAALQRDLRVRLPLSLREQQLFSTTVNEAKAMAIADAIKTSETMKGPKHAEE